LGIKGVIWYQGESNTAKASQYQRLFPAMIQDWRSRFGQGDFPFYFVQLANYLSPDTLPAEKSPWAELREAQEMTLSLPNTGMATAVDIGEANDIHPKNKQEVGRRLALIALKNLYQSDLPFLNPSMDKIEKIGTGFSVTFKNAEKGMKVKDRYGYAKGFAVAGADKKFYWAPARLEGGKVFVYSPQVPEPVYLRYGWANNPDDINLYNSAGLPLLPFRTDK
jgi:sialate O-acetylesterase